MTPIKHAVSHKPIVGAKQSLTSPHLIASIPQNTEFWLIFGIQGSKNSYQTQHSTLQKNGTSKQVFFSCENLDLTYMWYFAFQLLICNSVDHYYVTTLVYCEEHLTYFVIKYNEYHTVQTLFDFGCSILTLANLNLTIQVLTSHRVVCNNQTIISLKALNCLNQLCPESLWMD